jgi:hypothetical protein
MIFALGVLEHIHGNNGRLRNRRLLVRIQSGVLRLKSGVVKATTEQIRRAMHRQPFVPFTLRLVDGTSYVFKHLNFTAVPPTPRAREAT